MFATAVPELRIRKLNQADVNPDGDFLLYWMTMNRRSGFNFSLQRACELCLELGKPLLVFEALRSGYRWANDRLHRFAIQGMADNQRSFAETSTAYYPYLEPSSRDGAGLLESLADSACAVVTDDFPCFFIPAMLRLVAPKLKVSLEAIDSNGLLPMRATDEVFSTAYAFRRYLQRELPNHLHQLPMVAPLAEFDLPKLKSLPRKIIQQWKPATDKQLSASPEELQTFDIDHSVGPAAFDGGTKAAGKTLTRFLNERLENYKEERNEPEKEGSSGLSPYLHFGHVSTHDVFYQIATREDWSVDKVQGTKAQGKREGWWQMSEAAESFLDELVTWRELGYNMCCHRDDYDRYESLPQWARTTLEEHADDPRTHLYSLTEFENAQTHDPLWNAAQRQLVQEGQMHNYMRMLWGKKVLEWSESPQVAIKTLIHLNNKYAVDGRNPNSYSGIFWCLGRYDRAWGPERKIYGKIRYMTSDNTARKYHVKDYIAKFSDEE